MTKLPALFVSHGAPTMIIERTPAREFLAGFGATVGRPDAVLAVSAHWDTSAPAVSLAERPETVHDFFGFPQELYRLRYAAPGAPALAQRVASLLQSAGFAVERDAARGLDHGAWVPLMLMYPQADIPVTQLSIQAALGPAHHHRLGKALAALRDENVLILASGGATHNLAYFRRYALSDAAPDWVNGFREWIAAAVADGRDTDLLDYRRIAPHAAENHPTEEHFLPLFVALGARTLGTPGRRMHASDTYGVLAMDAYRFD
jgi:4,5-DOPA dioxygenase extradiol